MIHGYEAQSVPSSASTPVTALGEEPIFQPGDRIELLRRAPLGHYRVPTYVRGKRGTIVSAIKPVAVDNEQEGYGRNAGMKRHYYRVAILMTEIWPHYTGRPQDELRIEVFETWLKGV